MSEAEPTAVQPTKCRRLRELLAGEQLIVAPGVYDGISATLVGKLGFSAAYMTGAGVCASGFGLPDIGLLTLTEMAERAAVLAGLLEVPLIADADTGYGSPINVIRTVREYEHAGVAAIQLEDQVFPKRCGHLAGKEVIPADEFARVLQAAIEARRDPDTVIIARTDARAPLGIEEAIRRANRYAQLGADVIFVEAPRSVEEIEQIAARGRRATAAQHRPRRPHARARSRPTGGARLPDRDPPGRGTRSGRSSGGRGAQRSPRAHAIAGRSCEPRGVLRPVRPRHLGRARTALQR